VIRHLLIAATFVLVTASSLSAQHAVFVVRHAERADAGMSGGTMMASDPELSAAGRSRAEALAAMLKDAGITGIFVTEYKRTQQTAAPIAKATGLEPIVVGARDVSALVSQLKAWKGNALVIGHSNTVGEVMAGLGAGAAVKIADEEYDNLFVVFGGTLVRLRYGVGIDRK
jgi:phosphohistidine phosphatase SixA